jgi:hypothetical protein
MTSDQPLPPDEDDRSWFWRCCAFHIGLVVGFLAALLPAFIGWAALAVARGRGPSDVQSLARMGTLMWAASALVLAGLPCLASHGLWPLRRRLAVAVPVGVAWFVLGRCVLPDPSLPGVIRSAAGVLAGVGS